MKLTPRLSFPERILMFNPILLLMTIQPLKNLRGRELGFIIQNIKPLHLYIFKTGEIHIYVERDSTI